MMSDSKERGKEIRQFILEQVSKRSKDLAKTTAEHFGITRQAAGRHLSKLVGEGLLTQSGATRARSYEVATLSRNVFLIEVTPESEEYRVWREYVAPLLLHVKDNVRRICEIGVTETVNNVIDHSGSDRLALAVSQNAVDVSIEVGDLGIGIFNKIKQDFHLSDIRDALLELSKGKLTSDPERHSGLGIFYASRMFDIFAISSSGIVFIHDYMTDDWILEEKDPADGSIKFSTSITMKIALNSERMPQEVYGRYSTADDDDGLAKTHVRLRLVRYEMEQLVSRSQAKRVLSRLDEFREAIIDFTDVPTIGQAFADEIFRVFQNAHPQVLIVPVNTTPAVDRMIRQVTATGLKRQADTEKQG